MLLPFSSIHPLHGPEPPVTELCQVDEGCCPDADPHTEVPGGHLHFLEAIGPDHGTTAERVIPLVQLLAFLRIPSGLKSQGVSLQESIAREITRKMAPQYKKNFLGSSLENPRNHIV